MGSTSPSFEYLSFDPELCFVTICLGVSMGDSGAMGCLGDSSALGCLFVSKESPLHNRSICVAFFWLDKWLVLLLLAVDLVLFASE